MIKKINASIVERIAKTKNLYLILDYDGTLTPIVSRPSQAKLLPEMKAVLKSLSRAPGVRVAIISGRSLSNLEKLIRIDALDYVGNHGLERKLRGVVSIDPYAIRSRGFIEKLAGELRQAMKNVAGAMVEDKGYSLSVHYRNVSPRRVPKARRIFLNVWNDFPAKIFFKIKPGKKVWEVRPVNGCSDKGKVIRLLRQTLPGSQRTGVTVVYAGDDRTDEDAFRVLKKPDITIKVGYSGRTGARYRLRSPDEVAIFLKQLVQARKRISL